MTYNPLDHINVRPMIDTVEKALSESGTSLTTPLASVSAWENDRPGFCPKCGDPFGMGVAGNGDNVFFCENCCLTHPMPNA